MSFNESDVAGISGAELERMRSLLVALNDSLLERGVAAWVVGGFIRDWLLGRATADVDIAVRGDALEIAAWLASRHGGNRVVLDRENRVARVILPTGQPAASGSQYVFDFSSVPDDIERDLARRDFTVDAMAVELRRLVEHFRSLPQSGEKPSVPALPGLIDLFHGLDDLRREIIRAVGDKVFVEDGARLLRAVRLSAELDFAVDPATSDLIRRDSSLISAVAGERIHEELLRLLEAGRSEHWLFYLDDSGLLTALFPELAETRGVKQPAEHHWMVLQHSLRTVVAVDFLLRWGDWQHASGDVLDSVPWSAELARHFAQPVSHGSSRRSLLKLAALLHDVAKPQTRAIDDNGRMRFLGHPQQGAAIVADTLARLKFSTREIRLVETLVNYHLRPTQLSQDELPTNRAIYRYFRDTGEAGIDVLFLSLADHLATRGPDLIIENWREHTRLTEYLLTRHLEDEKITRPPKLLDGHDLIRIFQMSPGPAMGVVLEALREAQAAGEVSTRREALSFVGKLINFPGSLENGENSIKGD